jgi:NTP pyrophosphatase (non-canonical NTP hydrolase)
MKNVNSLSSDELIYYVRQTLGDDEILAHLAEEAAELAQAALKYRRAITGWDPTPESSATARLQLLEEVADVANCLDVLELSGAAEIELVKEVKLRRWVERLEGENA